MTTELGPQATKALDDFAAALTEVQTPADMFPPDFPEDGVREPRRPRVPPFIGCTCLALARVYDFQAARRQRLAQSDVFIERVDELLLA